MKIKSFSISDGLWVVFGLSAVLGNCFHSKKPELAQKISIQTIVVEVENQDNGKIWRKISSNEAEVRWLKSRIVILEDEVEMSSIRTDALLLRIRKGESKVRNERKSSPLSLQVRPEARGVQSKD